jgi:cell division protein FtsI (penicillin-binding protein 3)
MPRQTGSLLNRKIAFSTLFVMLLFCILVFRLFYIQIIKHKDFLLRAKDQNQRIVSLESKRGSIYDRNMRELAVSIKTDSAYLNPKEIIHPEETVEQLSKAVEINKSRLLRSIQDNKNFVWLKRQMSPAQARRLKELDLEGVGFVEEYKRFYPKRDLAGHVIGFVGVDNKGLEGIEYLYNNQLKGKSLKILLEKDALGRYIYLKENDAKIPSEGYDLVLTIDEVIQYIATKELKRQVIETEAKGGIVVVMDPSSGEIMALSEIPDFNPNNFPRYHSGVWRDSVVADGFEPGSTFKIISAAAAIEEKLVKEKEMIFCENGRIELGGVPIHDHEKYGWLSFHEVIQKSSNIGAIKVSQRLGREMFYSYIRKFGFGSKTGIDLPGEFSGHVRPPGEWSSVSIGSISIGQEILVTPIQLVSAMSAIANGGVLLRPRILKAFIDKGDVVKETGREEIRRVISPETSRIMTHILKGVVTEGTGSEGAVKGFSVAGKTGTAQKYDSEIQAYSKDKYLTSFVGFVPAEEPILTILVIIDEPKRVFWGGKAAAPVFSRIAEQALRYLMIPEKRETLFVRYDEEISKQRIEEDYQKEQFFSDVPQRLLSSFQGYFGFGKRPVLTKVEKEGRSG